MATGSGHLSPPWNPVSRPRSTVNVSELITAKPTSRAGTTRFRPNGSRAAMAAITEVNRAPRSGPVADMTISLSTQGDGQAAPAWRSSQLSLLVGADADPTGPDQD